VPRGGGLLDSYQEALDSKPILTKASTSLVGFAVSDAMTQAFIEKGDFDLKRLVKMASFGFLLHGTTGHYFYNFLDSVMAGATPAFVAAKVAIDQTLWAPCFMVMFFSYMMIFDGTPELIVTKCKNDIFTAVKGSWMTWIPAHTINFAFVSSDMRLLYINTIQIFFNMFMSVIGNTAAVAAE
jgi:protein Mpv17